MEKWQDVLEKVDPNYSNKNTDEKLYKESELQVILRQHPEALLALGIDPQIKE